MKKKLIQVAALSGAFAYSFPVAASNPDKLFELSLEELLQTTVTTASRKEERLQDVAAAAYVISNKDIEKSGATSIPEILRLAPGVHVARLASNRWAVSIRGFNGRFANKLLVLVDGRSIYSPLFSGVIWESEDTLIEDIERIEVIRGPGAAMWGTNAVNGVINIITKKPEDTQGNLFVAGAGTEERGFTAFRHGTKTEKGHYRVWGKAYKRDGSINENGQNANDEFGSGAVGFRADWLTNGSNRFVMTGKAYNNSGDDIYYVPDVSASQGFTTTAISQSSKGAHLMGRHTWLHEDQSETTLQAAFTNSNHEIESVIHEKRNTLDIDFQHRFQAHQNHDLVWGLNGRYSFDEISTGRIVSLNKNRSNFTKISAFINDEITLIPDELFTTIGARIERNSLSGVDFQPNIRFAWTPSSTQTVWGALSKAARSPSRFQDGTVELGVNTTTPNPTLLQSDGTDKEFSEKVIALDIGYRHQIHENLSIDMAAFYNWYRDLELSHSTNLEVFGSYNVQHYKSVPGMKAHSAGFEITADWQPTASWEFKPAYSFMTLSATPNPGYSGTETSEKRLEITYPKHQLSLLSSLQISNTQKLDFWLRYVSSIKVPSSPSDKSIPSYVTLDARYAWQASPKLEIILVGQNLIKRRHKEAVSDFINAQVLDYERGIYLKAIYRF